MEPMPRAKQYGAQAVSPIVMQSTSDSHESCSAEDPDNLTKKPYHSTRLGPMREDFLNRWGTDWWVPIFWSEVMKGYPPFQQVVKVRF